MEDFFSYLKGGAAVSAAPTELLNTFYLIGALLALASGKAERRQVHPLKKPILLCRRINLLCWCTSCFVGALETSAPPERTHLC